MTVRILVETDAQLVVAINETGLGLQEIMDKALALWLAEYNTRRFDGKWR